MITNCTVFIRLLSINYWVLDSVSFLWILFHQLLNWSGQAASGWVEIINLTMTKWLLVYWNFVKLSLSVTTRKVTCKTTFCYRQCRKHCSSFRLYWRDSRLNCEISALDQLLVSSELYVLYLLIVEICVELNLGWKVELVIVLSRHIVDELPTFANNLCLLTLFTVKIYRSGSSYFPKPMIFVISRNWLFGLNHWNSLIWNVLFRLLKSHLVSCWSSFLRSQIHASPIPCESWSVKVILISTGLFSPK